MNTGEERLGRTFPYTTPSGHTYHAPTDYRSLSARVMDYLQSEIEGWEEDESPPDPLTFRDYAKLAWNEAVRANDEIEHQREAIADLLERATTNIDPHFGHTPEDVNGHPRPRICQECTANLCDEDGEENWTDEQVEYWRSMNPIVIELRAMAAKLRLPHPAHDALAVSSASDPLNQ